jgi:glucokinase
VATAGVVDHQRGTIRSAVDTIADWAGTPVGAILKTLTGLPTTVENDVNAIAIAEQRWGAARGMRSALVVAVGTGIGGALVLYGRLWRGRTGTAGEIGHIPVDVLGRSGWAAPCSCGQLGHLEALSSGPAIARRYTSLVESPGLLNVEDVARACHVGDSAALSVVAEAGTVLGRALGGLVNVIDPDVIVLAGGVLSLGETFIGRITAGLSAETLPGPRGVVVAQSQFGQDAGLVGAAIVAFDGL